VQGVTNTCVLVLNKLEVCVFFGMNQRKGVSGGDCWNASIFFEGLWAGVSFSGLGGGISAAEV
jgi:hypothetical protein